MSAYKKIFCSFASSNMWRSAERIKKQAEQMCVYDHIYVYDENDLDAEFREHFKDKLVPSRGFGYWVWKPQVILQTLEKMNDGDILQYCDVGSHLNKRGIKRLNEYFEMANASRVGILGFQSKEPNDKKLSKVLDYPEKYWTKGDVFDYFGVRNKKQFYDTEQFSTGLVFVKKTKESINILHEWIQPYYDNFSLVDDTPSTSPNFDGIVENRHDQSIFSIIGKMHNIPTIASEETWQLDFNFYKLKYYPIWHFRDKDLGKKKMSQKIKIALFKTVFGPYIYSCLVRLKKEHDIFVKH